MAAGHCRYRGNGCATASSRTYSARVGSGRFGVAGGGQWCDAKHAPGTAELVVLRFGIGPHREDPVGTDHAVDDFVGMVVRDRVGHRILQALSVIGVYEREEPVEIQVLGLVDS